MTTKLLAVIAAAGFAFSTAIADPPKDAPKGDKQAEKHMEKAKDEKAGAQVGEKAPDFTLTDTDGKTVKLADFKDKIVVLEWYNPGCPFIVAHHKEKTTFNDLHKEFSAKGVTFLAINSSGKGKEGNGLEDNKKAKDTFKLPYPVLLDESGMVGHLYGAKTTPHCFVIGKDGIIAYAGAIDNQKEGADSKNYVRNALNSVLKGETVVDAKTKPYGCGVKYSSAAK